MPDYQAGQWVQVNVEGLVDLSEWTGKAAAIAARVTAQDPVTKLVTIVFDVPTGGHQTLTVPINRVRPPN